jgi:hypothetical protein
MTSHIALKATETRHSLDRDDRSKALNGMVGPVKKVALAQEILCRFFGEYPFC